MNQNPELPPVRVMGWELTWWKTIKLDIGSAGGMEVNFDLTPKQTLTDEHAFFWYILEAVRKSDASYTLLRITRETAQERS